VRLLRSYAGRNRNQSLGPRICDRGDAWDGPSMKPSATISERFDEEKIGYEVLDP